MPSARFPRETLTLYFESGTSNHGLSSIVNAKHVLVIEAHKTTSPIVSIGLGHHLLYSKPR